jgi:hypothetical protein
MGFRSKKFEFVEIIVPGIASTGQTGTVWNFPDLPKLRYTSLLGLSIYTANNISATPSGNTPITTAIIQKSFLVLYADDRQDLFRIPLTDLNRTQASTDPFIRQFYEFNGQQVTWDKSYVQIGSAPGNTTNLSFCFGVHYA